MSDRTLEPRGADALAAGLAASARTKEWEELKELWMLAVAEQQQAKARAERLLALANGMFAGSKELESLMARIAVREAEKEVITCKQCRDCRVCRTED